MRTYERGNGNGQAKPNVSATGDVLTGGQAGEGFAEALIAYAKGLAQGVAREAVLGGTAESGEHGSIEVGGGGRGATCMLLDGDDGHVPVGLGAEQSESDWFARAGGAVFGGEPELLSLTADGEGGVDPGEEVSRAAQALATGMAAVLAGMVDDHEGEVVGSLEFAQVAEDGGDVLGLVLVDAVQSHEGIEHKESRRMMAHGFV